MLAVMSEIPENSDLPDSWKVEEYELTGRCSLYAVFKSQDSEKEVHIVPYKTYGLPESTDLHRVTIQSPENGLEVVSEGIEVENADDAEEVAIKTMESS